MEIDSIVLKYTKTPVNVTSYDTGLSDWSNIDETYRGAILREKVVCKIDATNVLTQMFTQETVNKYKPVIMMIAKGQVTEPNTLSKCIQDFIEMDALFRTRIVQLFHSCPDEENFGWYVIQAIANLLLNVEAEYRSFFRGTSNVVICVSNGFLYFSIEDTYKEPVLPHKVEWEVLSRVKNWNGKFNFAE